MKYFTVLILGVILLSGCTSTVENSDSELPFGTSDIRDVGNGWVNFKYEGQCFLYQRSGFPGMSYFDRVLTKIDCKV